MALEALVIEALVIFGRKNRPVLPGGFRLAYRIVYSPLPNRRDHHPARRGWVSSVAAGAGSAGAEVEGSGGRLTEGAGSGCASTIKLTFSRTVERRRAA